MLSRERRLLAERCGERSERPTRTRIAGERNIQGQPKPGASDECHTRYLVKLCAGLGLYWRISGVLSELVRRSHSALGHANVE
jgi:hypothetical protein